ncbi:MAG: alpha-galactosidase [Clostridia bacterium]|nr:alpha-galactosidase [Clostridia bacterium]
MSASVSTNCITLENGFIKKEITLKNSRIIAFEIENKLSKRILTALKGSEEFVLSLGKGFFKKRVRASELKIRNADAKALDGKTVLRIDFEPFGFKGSEIFVGVVYTLGDRDAFMKKHIELSFEKIGSRSVVLDYVDFESLCFDDGLMHWSIPEQKNSHIPGFAMRLGQPVYIDSLYMGCEFPLCHNDIKDKRTLMRYYSGKSLSSLAKDGVFRTCNAVVGAAEGNLFAQVQKAFFSYIRTISKPCYLRRQYNSWYDNMLNITTENVTSSFLEIEKGLTKYGEPPVESFVADDGWNDYTKGFWSFNEKFPDGLTPFTNLSEAFGSRFGLWLGPRGGYTTDTPKFAKQIERAGNGYYNKQAMDICVASDKYAEKTGQLLLDFMKKYRLNYFKLDGFAQRPCKNKNHDHMTGGYKDMYFYTDIWEKWIKIFETLSDNAAEKFWINLTCYAPPSAWFLQWVNSVWMQISNDHGFIGKKGKISDKDGFLSYRDEMYFDFYETRQFQFPQMSLYNHDPIYGAEAKVKMSDDDFRSYLFTMAARGTSFWELYYSHSLMNEAKWRINHSALRFIDRNMYVLSHSVIFGGRPSKEKCYGFACFTGEEGILCLRNSGKDKQSFSVKLDEHIAVDSDFAKKEVCTVLPYTIGALTEKYGYGDIFSCELDSYETRIYHFGKKAEDLSVNYIHAENENTLEVSFDDFVGADMLYCDENALVKIDVLEDYMTLKLTFENAFSRENSYTLKGVCDIMGREQEIKLDFDYNENGVVIYGVKGNSGFTVKATLDESKNQHLMSQGEEMSLVTDEKGYAIFTVGFDRLVSPLTCDGVSQIVAVRERNGVMKLYFDGKLICGKPTENRCLKGEALATLDKVKVFDKAFSFDEV